MYSKKLSKPVVFLRKILCGIVVAVTTLLIAATPVFAYANVQQRPNPTPVAGDAAVPRPQAPQQALRVEAPDRIDVFVGESVSFEFTMSGHDGQVRWANPLTSLNLVSYAASTRTITGVVAGERTFVLTGVTSDGTRATKRILLKVWDDRAAYNEHMGIRTAAYSGEYHEYGGIRFPIQPDIIRIENGVIVNDPRVQGQDKRYGTQNQEELLAVLRYIVGEMAKFDDWYARQEAGYNRAVEWGMANDIAARLWMNDCGLGLETSRALGFLMSISGIYKYGEGSSSGRDNAYGVISPDSPDRNCMVTANMYSAVLDILGMEYRSYSANYTASGMHKPQGHRWLRFHYRDRIFMLNSRGYDTAWDFAENVSIKGGTGELKILPVEANYPESPVYRP